MDLDARCRYLSDLLCGLWAPHNPQLSSDPLSHQALTTFLDHLQCHVLYARLCSTTQAIFLSNTLDDKVHGALDETAVFLKLQQTAPLTPENMSTSLQLTSALQMPVQSLYHTIHQVYAPLLLQNERRALQLSPKLQDVLLELDAGLAGTVLLQGGHGDATTGRTDDHGTNFSSIVTLRDEIAYWELVQTDGRHARRAKRFSAVFDTIHHRCSNPLGDLSYDEMTELLDDVGNVADDLWRLEIAREQMYPQNRMDHFLGLVMTAINLFVQEKVNILCTTTEHEPETTTVWRAPFHPVQQCLQQGIALSDKWRSSIESLTGTLWPAYTERPWEGPISRQVERVQRLSTRLHQVLSVRTTYQELEALVPSTKRHDETNAWYRPFKSLRPLYVHAYTEPAWLHARTDFDRTLLPLETQVASILRERLRTITSKPSTAARVLQRSHQLLQRPVIRQALAGEREALVAQLVAHVGQLTHDFDTHKLHHSVAPLHVGKTLSPEVNAIVWAHALSRRVDALQRLVGDLFVDLAALPRLLHLCDVLVQQTSGFVLDRVREWQDATLRALDSVHDQGHMTGELLHLDPSSGDLVVTFSAFYVTLLRDVRVLTEYKAQYTTETSAWVPLRIQTVAQEAEQLYRFGVVLQKVANFYNTLEEQILETQKPMLLDSLLAFEAVIQRQKNSVTWGTTPDACDAYVQQLELAATKVAAENRRLKQAHEKLGDDVVALLDIDLVRCPAKWKDRWDVLKRSAELTTRKVDACRSAKWFLYWDHQVYKVLEAGYQAGLETLHERSLVSDSKTGPRLRTELVLGATLRLQPPVEELRTTYYKALHHFILRPMKFQGFGHATVYKAMCDANAHHLVRVYAACEDLFTKLDGLVQDYAGWTVVARIEDHTVSEHLTLEEHVDWEVHFKTMRLKRKESDKLPDQIQLDCLHLSLVAFKRSITEHLDRMLDILLSSLRKSILQHLQRVDEYLETGMERLTRRPHTLEELATAQTECQQLVHQRDAMQGEFDRAATKKTLFMTVLNSGIPLHFDTTALTTRFAPLPTRWENFDIALEAFDDMLADQREQLKSEFHDHVSQANVAIDKFSHRWHALRPVEIASYEDEVLLKMYTVMAEWRAKFDALTVQCTTLTTNCHALGLPEPVFDSLRALERDVALVERHWTTYRGFHDDIRALSSHDWFAFGANLYVLVDTTHQWATQAHELVRNGMENTPTMDKLTAFHTSVKRAFPTLKLCRGEPFKDDHWTQLFRKLGLPRHVEKHQLLVEHFLSVLDLLEQPSTLQFVQTLHARAQGEVTIRDALQELRAWTETAEFTLKVYPDLPPSLSLVKDWPDVLLTLGEHQALVLSLKDSPFFPPFELETRQYEVKLTLVEHVVTTLQAIQRKWLFLAPIFDKRALPSETTRFQRIDDEFRAILTLLALDPRVWSLVDDMRFPQLETRLSTLVDQLDRCQKALSAFLETKRQRFPRFYFLGDDDLLELVGQAQTPPVLQLHVKKLYQGVAKVEFSPSNDAIVAMWSAEGERVGLKTPVVLTSQVDDWLARFTLAMHHTLEEQLRTCLTVSVPDLTAFPSQILSLAAQIRFCRQAEAAIEAGTVQTLKHELVDTLQALTSVENDDDRIVRLKIQALVLDVIHHVAICDELLASSCRKVTEWSWQKQLRVYQDATTDDNAHDVKIRLHAAEFRYSFEYQGNAPKLVHTPLMDKCFVTLTQAMQWGLGGNPFGPAGTGKTESVKALASQLGRPIIVLNCDENVDHQAMGRLFQGVVQCGAWGCFDEFNRLKADQLSAISHQLQRIQAALLTHQPTMELLDRTIPVDHQAGIFVTLNPAGKDYGGRSKLPDNLKALFRPIAMGQPDNTVIAQVLLYTQGFHHAETLASKLVAFFSVAHDLLSPQQHYDWGLRALKAVLVTAGKLFQASTGKDNEASLVVQAIERNTLSKLTVDDQERFQALLVDVFPGVGRGETTDYNALDAAIQAVFHHDVALNVTFDPRQVVKIKQLHQALSQRMGCVLVGPSGSGKTTVWRVLERALARSGQEIKTYVMNPKAMTREELLGSLNLDTREWTDGVLTAAARKMVKEADTVRSWLVCDGDVDPEWIEALNSVLDDNHVLTLPTGERLQFPSTVNFLFETHELRFASPATVSRMAMLLFAQDDVALHSVVTTWGHDKPKEWMDWSLEWIPRALEALKPYQVMVETTKMGTIKTALRFVEAVHSKNDFLTALVRGLGTNLAFASRVAFAKALHVDVEDDEDIVSTVEEHVSVVSLVETKTSHRTLKLLAPWIQHKSAFLLVGPPGCGKTLILRHAFQQLDHVTLAIVHCNAQTTAEHVKQKVAQCCVVGVNASGRVYRPRDAERLVLYLKDINLPTPDRYGTSPLLAFLHQVITCEGFYAEEALDFVQLERIQIVVSMTPASTVGRYTLSTRFTGNLPLVYMDYPSTQELVAIYTTFLTRLVPCLTLQDVEKVAYTIVQVYDAVQKTFTVDEHRHYLFTPRDLTLWVESLARYDLEKEKNHHLLTVLAYEAHCIFGDRLVTKEAKRTFDGLLQTIWKQQWQDKVIEPEGYYTTLACPSVSTRDTSLNAGKRFEKLDREAYARILTQGIIHYERDHSDLKIVVFDQVLDQCIKMERVVTSSGGSLLLIGKAGVGRRSSITLLTYLLQYSLFSPSITRTYTATSFRNDLKLVLLKAALEGHHTVVYLEEHHLVDNDAILELTNSLLSSGDVPGLFTFEELEPQLVALKEELLERIGSDFHEQFRTVYDLFIARVHHFVHLVVAMDPRHPAFLVRCERNPALYTRCTMLWMDEWSLESLEHVPSLVLTGSALDEATVKHLTPFITFLYSSVKHHHHHATPREFICLLGTWRMLYERLWHEIVHERKHLQTGLSKLDEAKATVDGLSLEAVTKQKQVQKAQIAADEAMLAITNALDRAAVNRRHVEELQAELAIAEQATTTRKGQIEDELAAITPILQRAMDAVGNIKSDNLNEIRSLKMPPEPIHDVLSAVLMLLNIQDTSWHSMKKFLGTRGVKDEILTFDAHRISPEIFKNVTKLVKMKNTSFDQETIYRVSVAAAPLATWVQANLQYAMVLNKIEPLEKDLDDAKRTLEASQARLAQCENELATIDTTVAQMKVQFSEKTKEAELLRVNLDQAQGILSKAQGLVTQLSGEKTRWSRQVQELENRLEELPVRLLLAAAFTTFLGKCSEDTRHRMVKTWQDEMVKWTDKPVDTEFAYHQILSRESELLTWKSRGLPDDDVSMENAVIVSKSSAHRCVFIIDPANASTSWLEAELAQDPTRPLSVIQSQDPRFVSLVEQAVRFGRTLVIKDVETIEPYLYPLLRKDLVHQGPRFVVTLGDKVIDYNENFRLFLTTRHPTPCLPPDALAIVNVINFTVTKSGLESQLLGVTIQHEQPALEEEKTQLVRQEEDAKVQLAVLEKQLVEALATSEGDILDNTLLVESLTRTKATSAEIETALEKSAEKARELHEKRKLFAPFAQKGAQLFFLVKQLSAVNHMYHFSLESFLRLFRATLDTKVEMVDKNERILKLIPILEVKVLMFIGRGLLKEHRAMFGIHLVHGMHPECFEKNEYAFFCGQMIEKEEGMGQRLPDWIPTDRKEMFLTFMDAFPALTQRCKFESPDLWLRWIKSIECEQQFHPKIDVSAFQKLLIVQTLRPDRLQSAILHFICSILQLKSLTPPSLDFKSVSLNEATSTIPVLLLTSTGADPSKELEQVALSVVGKDHYFEVAMGGGQQELALKLLQSTAAQGDWLCLQNLHLVIAWLPVLEKEFTALTASHKFRLWLTTEPHDAFPLVLLEQSLKITFESPPGMKKTLQRLYSTWCPEEIAQGSLQRAQLLFLLAFFHALVQERRTFIPQGWTQFYEFSFGDFRAGSNVIELAARNGKIDWQSLHGLMENAIYGGRMDHRYDLRVLQCYLTTYFTPEVLSGHKPLIRGVKMPQSTQYNDYMDLIERLPDIDNPSMFHLPDNIERSIQRSLSNQVISQLKTLSSSETQVMTFNREKWRAQLGPLLENWTKLTTGLQVEGKKEQSAQTMTPVDAVVALENEFGLELVQQVHTSLQALKKVIYGTGLLTPAIQTIAKALLQSEVPTEWSSQWEGPENVSAWLRGLVRRKRALAEWQKDVKRGQLLSQSLDLSQLFHPGTFLNALRQQSAREQKCAMDEMKLLSCWERERLNDTKVEWFELTNLMLQGASFEGGTLLETLSDAPELMVMPSCFVAFVSQDAQEMYDKENSVQTPLYYAIDRKKVFVELLMPISEEKARWVLAGVALFLND